MYFKSGLLIMDFGVYVKIMFLIIKGSIKVLWEDEEGNELFLYYLKFGEICFMFFICCLMDKKSEIWIVVEEDMIFIGIFICFMDEWMSCYLSWKNFVMIFYDNCMLELVCIIDSIVFKKMDECFMDYLE